MKTFDCVKFQRDARERLWLEAGETVEGYNKLISEKTKKNKLWKELSERKEKEKQLKSA